MENLGFDTTISRGNGYDWDAGKSNNAINAEEEGLMNATNLSKILKIESAFILESAPFKEWHHTSSRFNETKYFNLENVKEWFNKHGIHLYNIWKKEKEAERGSYKAICKEEWFEKEYCFGRSGRKGGYVHYERTFKAIITDKGGSFVEVKIRKGTNCDVKRFGETHKSYKMKAEILKKKKDGKKFHITKLN